MPLDCIPISDLTPAKGVCKIKVRIVRMWGFPKKNKPGEYAAIDLLLLDEKGDRIQASIKPTELERFKDQLEEGSCYDVMNFELGPNLGQFRGCSHPYKINFIFYTCVKPCENLLNSKNRYNFCPFDEIVRRSNDDSVFVDIIGEIAVINELKDVRTVDGPTKLLNLQLRDLGDSTLDVALWGKIAEEVYTDVKSQKTGPVIFLGSLMKTSQYNRKGTAQSSKFATKVFINPSLPEVIKFQELSSRSDSDTTLAIIPVQSSLSLQASRKSFSISDLKTISQLSELNKDMSCNIFATIVSIETGNSWFFTGCKTCFTTVTPYFNPNTEETEPDKFSCKKCDKQITTTQNRFKLKFQAMDDIGTTTFISFDDVVIPLIKKSAYQLLEEQVQFNRKDLTPPELLDLIGCKFVFKILVTNTDKYNQSSTYRVVSLTSDPDIIQTFSDSASNLNDGQLDTITESGYSVGTSIQDAKEPESITVSGSSVATSTQITMVSSDKELVDNTCSDANIPTPTSKRSLHNSKDDAVQQSSTKPNLMYTVKKEKKKEVFMT